jgi:selenophosphate synthase
LSLEENWRLFAEYSNLGFDPLKWLPDCFNELKFEEFGNTVNELKRSNLKFIIPSYYSYFHYPEKKDAEIIRRVYKLDEGFRHEDLKTKKAVSILKLHKNIVYDEIALTERMKKIADSFDTKIEVDKVSMIPTRGKGNSQFILFDHILTHRGNKTGYTIVTNSNTQATDVTQPINSPIHLEIAFTESISLLNLLGCTKDIKLYPVYDAPNEEMLDEIRKNIDRFTIKYNYTFEDYSSLKLGGLFFGTTAVGNTHKEIPNKYELIEPGMQIIVTEKMGVLTFLGLYVINNLDDSVKEKMQNFGIDFSKIIELKDQVLKNLTEPKLLLGKSISKYLPDFENEFDSQSHILVAHTISKKGVSAFYELAKLINKEVLIDQIPYADSSVAKFLAKEYLISNVTASTPETNMLIVSDALAPTIIEELSRHKFNPTVVGKIGNAGKAKVSIRNNNIR